MAAVPDASIKSAAAVPGVPEPFVLENSELVSGLREVLKPKKSGEQRRVFLPWFAPSETAYRDSAAELAGALKFPLVALPARYSVTQDARLLAALALCFCESSEYTNVLRVLGRVPYSPSLEDAVLLRIRRSISSFSSSEPSRLAIAAPASGADADAYVERMLAWVREVGVGVVLVLANNRPQEPVETVSLSVQRLQKDVVALMMKPPDTSQGFYRRLWDRLLQITRGDPKNDDAWVDLLARICAANWARAKYVAAAWSELDGQISKYLDGLPKGERLSLETPEDEDTLERQLRFVVVLSVVYPEVFRNAVDELDGADQLYRVLLILSGQTARDTMVASHLVPFWQHCVEDPFFRELFHACFDSISTEMPLVPRPGSRTQLHRLLVWVENKGGTGKEDSLERFLGEHARWIRGLASTLARMDGAKDAGAPLSAERDAGKLLTEAAQDAGKLLTEADSLLAAGELTATAALQVAQTLVSVCEVMPDTPSLDDLRQDLFGAIDRSVKLAINQSRGAIRFDATLLLGRTLAIRGQHEPAFELLRRLRRTASDPLSRCAVELEEAFVHERRGDLLEGTHGYQNALKVAEPIGADELVARAASGCLRCDATAAYASKPELLTRVRASIVVEIQAARAPQLFFLSQRDRPTLFISYRSETSDVTERLHQQLKKDSRLSSWTDKELKSDQDFNPIIHRRLHDSNAIVLLMSPGYFDSPWCVHELHSALEQYAVRRIPLYWAWLDNSASTSESCETIARSTFTRMIEHGPASRAMKRYQLNHVNDRLKTLFEHSQLLVPEPLPFGDDVFASKAAEQLEVSLRKATDHIYSRARLPPPMPEAGPQPDPTNGTPAPASE